VSRDGISYTLSVVPSDNPEARYISIGPGMTIVKILFGDTVPALF
jgi:hypothetical protein